MEYCFSATINKLKKKTAASLFRAKLLKFIILRKYELGIISMENLK